MRFLLVSGGVALAVLAYGGSLFALPLGVKDRIIASLVHAGIATHPQAAVGALAVLAHAETGVTPTTSPAWLIVAAPHSGSIADVLGCLSVCLTMVGLLLPVGDLLVRRARSASGRTVQVLGDAVAAAGGMSLTIYSVHIIGMWLITRSTGHSFGRGQSWSMLVTFTVVLFAAAALWQRFVGRGPFEVALHSCSVRAAHMFVSR